MGLSWGGARGEWSLGPGRHQPQLSAGVDHSHTGAVGGFPEPHLRHGLEQRQAEPLEEGEGPDAARRLEGGHGGDVGVQVAGDLLEDLGLVEIQFSLKEQRESGSHLQGAGTGAVPGR